MNNKIPDIKSVVATNLVRFRKESKQTQLQVANKINYSDKALSKWERGESLPDVCVLKQIATIYNVELDDILHEKTPKEKLQSLYRNKLVISVLSVLLVWLVAMVVYVMFELIAPGSFDSWQIFFYAIPASAVVALIFNNQWGSRIYNMVIVSVIDWGLAIALVITLKNVAEQSWYLYFIAAIFEIMIIIWYMMDFSRIVENRKERQAKFAKERANKKADAIKAKELKKAVAEKAKAEAERVKAENKAKKSNSHKKTNTETK